MKKSYLAITLGHNSSCCLIEENKVVCGYEEERFTRKKSDSSFPYKSIEECLFKKNYNLEEIYITHWFENPIKLVKNKWYDSDYLDDLKDDYNCRITTTDLMYTHHSAHADSVIAFASQYENVNGYDVIVCDGFGNYKEVFSHYINNNGRLKLLYKINGYENSLGLMYQYATDYCGMKMNQDEYKFLGYESKIYDLDFNKKELFEIVEKYINSQNMDDRCFDELNDVKVNHFFKLFDEIMKTLNSENNEENKRIYIGFSVQLILEKWFENYIKSRKIKNVLLAGGVFYNVKLNNMIMNNVEKISIMPISGDSGAALGLYYHHHKKLDMGDFCWGIRNGFKNEIELEQQRNIIDDINSNKIINLVKGNMEFGPRALGNTSTLALPNQQNVDKINIANSRNTVMPMAPIITEKKFNELFFFREIKKIIGSHYYMIITFIYQDYKEELAGVMHIIPNNGNYSGRVQVINKKHSLYNIVNSCGGILINTSYNIHGQPIVYDDVSDNNNGFKTYLIKKELEVVNG